MAERRPESGEFASASLMNPVTCAPLNRLLRVSVLLGDRGFTYLTTGTAGGARQVRRSLE